MGSAEDRAVFRVDVCHLNDCAQVLIPFDQALFDLAVDAVESCQCGEVGIVSRRLEIASIRAMKSSPRFSSAVVGV